MFNSIHLSFESEMFKLNEFKAKDQNCCHVELIVRSSIILNMRCPKYVVLPSVSGATYKQPNQQTTLPRSVNYKSVMKARAKTTKLTVSSPTKAPSIPSAPSELCGSRIYSIHSTLFMYEINLYGPNRATVIFLPLIE